LKKNGKDGRMYRTILKYMSKLIKFKAYLKKEKML